MELDAATYPDESVQETITQHAVPVKVDMWRDRDLSRKLKALWTPNLLYLDPDGNEWHRDLGYLPPDEFDAIGNLVRTIGFRLVASGPFVRSSYHAREMVE